MTKPVHMILSSLYIQDSFNRGRGVFSSEPIAAGTIIEVSPVIVLSQAERVLLDQTLLHDYIFVWGSDEKECCIALGYLSCIITITCQYGICDGFSPADHSIQQ
jgi:hypothetical protein